MRAIGYPVGPIPFWLVELDEAWAVQIGASDAFIQKIQVLFRFCDYLCVYSLLLGLWTSCSVCNNLYQLWIERIRCATGAN